jgi:hypothetical protein
VVDVSTLYDAFRQKGLEVIWIFGADSSGEPVTATWLEHFVMTSGVNFPVVMDYEFEQTFKYLSNLGEPDTLPKQYLIDPRTMELVFADSGVADPNWDMVDVLLERP